MTVLGDPLQLGQAIARNRIVFGPHETNLGRNRELSDRHVAYYHARAAGGAGLIVVEEASVHSSDWPYERAPLAASCAPSWQAVASACHAEGALVIAALGHAGGQGSSAYHQQALWAPWRTPDVTTREVPTAMEEGDIEQLIGAFAAATRSALEAGCDGVEVNAGQWSLLRQFASGLTNQRQDRYGTDRANLLSEVLTAVGAVAGSAVVGLRLSCDELAPWAGIVPEAAVELACSLADPSEAGRPGSPGSPSFDYVTVVRGSAYGCAATRPDSHVESGFNLQPAAAIRRRLPATVAVVVQGSIVDAEMARRIVLEGEADAVEMTRAQIADPAMATKALRGDDATIRPCVLCNQMCQVRDARNPIVTCIGEPRSGHETDDPDIERATRSREPDGAPPFTHLVVVGGGPAGLECARTAALIGCDVTLFERRPSLGGMVDAAAARVPGRGRLAMLTAWLERECRRLGVELVAGHEATVEELDSHAGPIALCTGSRPGRRSYEVVAPASVVSAAEVLAAERLPGDPGPPSSVVWDPIGGPVGVGVAELLAALGGHVVLVTPDFVAGEQLARSGDLAPANVRLARAGVEVVKHAVVRAVDAGGVTIEDRLSGARRLVGGALLVDAAHRLGDDTLCRSLAADTGRPSRVLLAGDAVAPRTIHEAVLEGRRVALALAGLPAPGVTSCEVPGHLEQAAS